MPSPSRARSTMEMDGGFERLTSHRPAVFFFRITEDQLQFTPDMKKLFALTMLISLAMICSCQKQDSAAEQQLAQRKTELDAREDALDERMNALDEKVKALDEKVKALAENEKSMANTGRSSTGVQNETPDPAQEQAEIERIQQFSAEMRAKMADPSRLNSARAEKERRTQEGLPQRQQALEALQNQNQRKSKISSGAVFPAPASNSLTPSSALDAASPTSSPPLEANSPTASPAAEATLPTSSPTP